MNSILDYLRTYGWIVIVVGMVGSILYITSFAEVEHPDFVDTGEQFLDDQMNGFTCSNAFQNKEGEYTVDCYRSIDYNNSTVYNTRSFQITEYNDSAAVKAR